MKFVSEVTKKLGKELHEEVCRVNDAGTVHPLSKICQAQADKMIQPQNRLRVILHGWWTEAAQILPSIKFYCDYTDEIAAYDGVLYKDTTLKYHITQIALLKNAKCKQ